MGRSAGARRTEAARRQRVPAALSGADQGSGALGRRLRRLRGGGDLPSGARRGRADRGRLRAAAGARLDRARQPPPARRGSGTDCPDNIGFVQLFGDKAATDAAFAKADHVVKHRFVINRVTAATMEPRGCLGDYNAAEDRYTIYTTLQRVHPFRAELAPMLKVPESKIRVVAGDIGGSFGMKSAVYNEVALVLLASKVREPAGEMDIARARNPFSATRRRATTSPRPSLRSTRDGNFLGHARDRRRQHRRLSADRHAGLHRQYRHARRRLSHPRDARRRHRRVHPHQSGAALSRQRPAGGRLCDRAAGRSRRRRARRSIRPSCGGATTFRPTPCRSRPRSPSPTTAASSRRAWTWRSSSPMSRASSSGARNRASTASCAASASPTPSSARPRGGFEGAEIRFDKSGTVTLFAGSVTQGQGHETIFKQIMCDRLGTRSRRRALRAGRYRPGLPRRRHRRLALRHDRRIGGRHGRASRIATKAKQIAAHAAQGRCRRHQLRRRRLLQPQDQSHAHHQGSGEGGDGAERSCRRAWMSA